MRQTLGLVGILVSMLITAPATAQVLSGSGSTFAFPVISQWVAGYQKASGVRVENEPIGSSAGLIEIKSGLVDFAVSDVPISDAQLLRDALAQFSPC